MKKASVLVPLLLLTASFICVAAIVEELENKEVGKVRHLPMAGVEIPLPEFHDRFRRFEFGNSPQVRPQGIIVTNDTSASLQTYSDLVLGFPCILNFRVTLEGESPRAQWVLDLAASADPSARAEFFAVAEDRRAYSFSRGPADFYDRQKDRPLSMGVVWLQKGDTLSMWFDLLHLMTGRYVVTRHSETPQDDTHPLSPIESEALLPTGNVQFVMVFNHSSAANEKPALLRIRPPNRDEKAFLEEIGYGQQWKSWFPDLVLSDVQLPSSGNLPTATQIPVRLMELLREAVRNPERGLDLLYSSTSVEWGVAQDLIHQIEYECLLDTGQEEKANGISNRLEAANIRLIRESKGLLAAYRKLYD